MGYVIPPDIHAPEFDRKMAEIIRDQTIQWAILAIAALGGGFTFALIWLLGVLW